MIPLRAQEVHLWQCALDKLGNLQALEEFLTEPERARAARFHFHRDRDWFVRRRALLRWLLSEYLSEAPACIEIIVGPHGKPGLRQGSLEFNLTHSRGLTLVALAWRPVGTDLEWIQEGYEFTPLLPLVATASEQRCLVQLAPGAARQSFFRLWTRKEAILKAAGFGLSRSPSSFDADAALNPGDWRAVTLEIDPRYAAAVAACGGDWHCLRFEWRGDLKALRRGA